MKVNKVELLEALEKVKPGLANKDLIEQSTSFAFMATGQLPTTMKLAYPSRRKGLGKHERCHKSKDPVVEFLAGVKDEEIEIEQEEKSSSH